MGKLIRGYQAAVRWALQLRVVRALLLYTDSRGGLLSAAITFRMLFAVFAAVFLGFSVASIWLSTRSDLWEALVETVDGVVPGLVGLGGDGALIDVSNLPDITSSVAAPVISIIALVWALLGGVGNVRMSIRSIAGTRHDESNALIMRAFDLIFALSIGVLVIASAVVTFLGSAFVDTVLEWLGSADNNTAEVLTRIGTVLVTFILDAVIVAWLFWLMAGAKPTFGELIPGSLIGGAGLVVLQQASGLFLGGADNNPLLVGFASLIALLLWFNLSAQVVLIACSYIVVTIEEKRNRVAERHGAETLTQRVVRSAERNVRVAEEALAAARDADQVAREKEAERAAAS
ncbi:YihY/virulence factor BrkB family protein [Microbacterium gubbeenense]|uniref:YihY/virulence factor BrkB family protein n=2 Tax=Microbacterium gubbeenense TaxID=159896 RepID=UPI0003FAEB6D|nr:YihY/virulence factor BrkB family protein [Microbacterium gubbeenense]